MPGWEAMVAAIGGLAIGAGLAGVWARGRHARLLRERFELEASLRRNVIPVLERRADVLGIPPAERGREADGTVAVAMTLARAIKSQEESVDLPFGDTVEVDRARLEEAQLEESRLDTTKNEKRSALGESA